MPPAPVYKHEAIYDRRKAKPDAGSQQPRPRGWSPGQGDLGKQAVSPTRSGRGSCAPRARRVRVVALGSGRAAFVFEAPRGSGLGSAWAWRDPAPQALFPATLRALPPTPSPSSPQPFFSPPRFSVYPTRHRENYPYQGKRNSLRKLKFQTKTCPYKQLGGSNQPLIFNFLSSNTYSLA